jgi:hypothetical protein
MKGKQSWVRSWTLALCLGAATLAAASTALAGGESMRGTVTGSSGQLVASAWVVVERGGAEQGKSLTGDDGRYYIGGLDSGSYQITVRKGDQVLYRGTVSLPANQAFDIRVS